LIGRNADSVEKEEGEVVGSKKKQRKEGVWIKRLESIFVNYSMNFRDLKTKKLGSCRHSVGRRPVGGRVSAVPRQIACRVA